MTNSNATKKELERRVKQLERESLFFYLVAIIALGILLVTL